MFTKSLRIFSATFKNDKIETSPIYTDYVSQTTKAKMSTINIPQSFQTALSQVTNSAVSNAIAQLSERYGFDAEEAGRDLKIPAMDFVAGATKGKAKSATTKKNGEPKKKRGTTGYLVFSKEMREEVKAEMEAELGDGEKLQPKLVVSSLLSAGRSLTMVRRPLGTTRPRLSMMMPQLMTQPVILDHRLATRRSRPRRLFQPRRSNLLRPRARLRPMLPLQAMLLLQISLRRRRPMAICFMLTKIAQRSRRR